MQTNQFTYKEKKIKVSSYFYTGASFQQIRVNYQVEKIHEMKTDRQYSPRNDAKIPFCK